MVPFDRCVGVVEYRAPAGLGVVTGKGAAVWGLALCAGLLLGGRGANIGAGLVVTATSGGGRRLGGDPVLTGVRT